MIDARRGSRLLAILTLIGAPIVMPLSKVGLIVGLGMLLGACVTLAVVFYLDGRKRDKLPPHVIHHVDRPSADVPPRPVPDVHRAEPGGDRR